MKEIDIGIKVGLICWKSAYETDTIFNEEVTHLRKTLAHWI